MKAQDMPPEMFVEPGRLTIEVSGADLEPSQKTLVLKAGDTTDFPLDLKPKQAAPPSTAAWTPPLGLVVGAAGLAVAGIAAGAGLTVAAGDQAGKAQALAVPGGASACTAPASSGVQACTKLKDAWIMQDSLTNAAVGAFVTAGVFTLVTGGLFVWR